MVSFSQVPQYILFFIVDEWVGKIIGFILIICGSFGIALFRLHGHLVGALKGFCHHARLIKILTLKLALIIVFPSLVLITSIGIQDACPISTLPSNFSEKSFPGIEPSRVFQ